MAFPSWQYIFNQVTGKLDLPYPATQVINPGVFQVGLNEAFDVMYSAFLAAQLPRIEIVSYVTVVPGTTALTAADMGILNFGDFIYLSERTLGSNDRYIDLEPVDRLAQEVPTERLRQFNYRDNTFFFIGATTTRQLEIKYDSSGIAPSDPDALITVDACANFLTNYIVGVLGPRKGYDEIGAQCMRLALGANLNPAVPGGQLYALIQPLVRSRQNVQVARKPFTARRRIGTGWATPFIGVQQGTTGGGVQNVPIQLSTFNGTVLPTPDGTTTVFVLIVGVVSISVVSLNGLGLTLGVDYTVLGNQITMTVAPGVTDVITCEVYIATQ